MTVFHDDELSKIRVGALAICLLAGSMVSGCADHAVMPDAGAGDGHVADGECANFPDGFECTDGNPCTIGDRCISGVCTGRPKDCSAFDGPCIDGFCDTESGECVTMPEPDGSTCDDGLFCFEGDTCYGGVCIGAPADCDDGDACTRDDCNEGESHCDHTWEQRPGLEGPYTDTSCTNGLDDDCDRLTDDDDPDCTDTCSGHAKSLAEEIYASEQGCTAVVRLDYETMELLSYQLVCGPYQTTSCQAGEGVELLSPPDAEDECVYYVSPVDFGYAAAVSISTSLLVFEAGIVWMGFGDITFPTSWRPASELGFRCHSDIDIPSTRGYSLIPDGSTLAPMYVDAAISVVRDTAILTAFSDGGTVHSAVVLLYPRCVGDFDPITAEWIILINGGP